MARAGSRAVLLQSSYEQWRLNLQFEQLAINNELFENLLPLSNMVMRGEFY